MPSPFRLAWLGGVSWAFRRREAATDSVWALASHRGRGGGGRTPRTACGDGWTLTSASSLSTSLLMGSLRTLVRKREEAAGSIFIPPPARPHRAAVWTHAPPSLLPPRSHRPHPGRPFPLALSPPDRRAATRLGRPAQPGDRPLWLVSPSGCGAEGTRDPHCIAMCTECLTQTKERCVNPKEKPREEPPTARSGAATGSDAPARAARRSGGKGTAHPTAVVHGVRHKGSPSNLF